MQGVWKMPTGLVNASEDVSEAAVREVLEVRSCLMISAGLHVRRVTKQWAGVEFGYAITACGHLLHTLWVLLSQAWDFALRHMHIQQACIGRRLACARGFRQCWQSGRRMASHSANPTCFSASP